ncbi:hypothetical protein CYMTET_26504 [Cymbomonas tetramitiformis]|uniref:Uncharacterized protein n=1 Tax=Cymbomonas tetramitiformis TaxID=36881 RepID=A0AAE0FSF6_9CHLO|nr:hypothetical protein CYMTET_26504 [Cymbomonas tetramitiformis]
MNRMFVKRKPVKARGSTRFHLQARKMVNYAWTSQEDGYLTDIVNKLGPHRWEEISRIGFQAGVLVRDSKSCRLRWWNQLSGYYSKKPFEPAEDLLICQMHAVIGDKWAEIARRLDRRNDNQVKNRFNSHIYRCCKEMLKQAYKQHAQGQLPQELYDDLRNVKPRKSSKPKKPRDVKKGDAPVTFSDCENDCTANALSEFEVGLLTTATSEGSTELSADLACSSSSAGATTWQKMRQEAMTTMGCALENEESSRPAALQQCYQASMPIYDGVVIAASAHRHDQLLAEPMAHSRVVQHPQGARHDCSGAVPAAWAGSTALAGLRRTVDSTYDQLKNTACDHLNSAACDHLNSAACDHLNSAACDHLNSAACDHLNSAACDHLNSAAGATSTAPPATTSTALPRPPQWRRRRHLNSAACDHLTNTIQVHSWPDIDDSGNTSGATSIPSSAMPLGRRTLPATANDESLSMLEAPCVMRAPAICSGEELGSSAGEAGSASATVEVEVAAAGKRPLSAPSHDASHKEAGELKHARRARSDTRNAASGSPENTLRWTVRKRRSDPQTPRNSPAGQALGFSTARSSVLQAAPTQDEGSDLDSTEWCNSVREGSMVLLKFCRAAAQAMENMPRTNPPRNLSGRHTKKKKKVSNYRVLNSAGFDKA